MITPDSLGLWGLVEQTPERVETAARLARGLEGLPEAEDVEQVVVLGAGEAGGAGDVLLAVAGPLMAVPVVTVESYECPAFVGDGTLVFAVSASGETEETVQAASDAAVAGGRMVVVTGGGELGRLAAGWGAPTVALPPEVAEPRPPLGVLAVPPLVVLEEIGLFKGATFWIDAAVSQLRRRRDSVVGAGEASPPAVLARRIGRTFPLVHGGGTLGAAAARHWKAQINLNAKAPAWWAAQPQLTHDEVCGWGQHGDVTRQVLTAVSLRHDGEHPQVGRRAEVVGELLREVVADVLEVRAEGEGDLAQLLDLALFGDYVSLWMAAFADVDPGPAPVLAELVRQLAGS